MIKPKYIISKAYGYDYGWLRTFPIKSALHHFNKALTIKLPDISLIIFHFCNSKPEEIAEYKWAQTCEILILLHANTAIADQPPHSRSLIGAFAIS